MKEDAGRKVISNEEEAREEKGPEGSLVNRQCGGRTECWRVRERERQRLREKKMMSSFSFSGVGSSSRI